MGWRSLSGSLLCAAGLACAGGVPAPPFTTPIDRVPADSIRAYLNELEFDHRDGAGDVQHLLVDCAKACRVGPLVGVFPERRIHHNSTSNLAEGAGRIIAQIINYDTTQGYLPLNLGKGDTVYWAVDSLQVTRDSSRGRSLFVSAEAMRTRRDSLAVKRPLKYRQHPVVEYAAARWVLDTTYYPDRGAPGGEGDASMLVIQMTAWGVCKSGGCCK